MLGEIQRALETIYAVTSPQRVEDYVVDPAALRRLGATVRAPEELLVVSGQDEAEVALFVSPEIIARLPELAGGEPRRFLGDLLPSFAVAAEGVSHFLYFTLQAMKDRAVSLLELETQAEVDKFATGVLHLWKHGERRRSSELRERLFDRVSYREGLTGEERACYGFANRLARSYAAFLESRFVAAGRLEALLAELRLCYRLPSEAKFARLLRAA